MEKMVTIDVFSDNMKMNKILDVLHDIGLKTAGMASKADQAYMNILWKRWHGNFDDYGRAPGKAIQEHYTRIDGRTIARRAIYLEREG